MSLIQDALRRKEEEPGKVPEISPSPVAPAPPPKTTGSRKKWFFLIGVLLFLTAGNTIVLVHQLVIRKKEPALVIQPEPEPAPESAPVPAPISELAPVPAPVPDPESQKIVWPELVCSGFAAETGDLAVVINGKTLSVGDSIEGVKILKILKTMILLEFRGEKRVLRI